ncbi:MAG: sulfatase [Planctomycetota bacterium]
MNWLGMVGRLALGSVLCLSIGCESKAPVSEAGPTTIRLTTLLPDPIAADSEAFDASPDPIVWRFDGPYEPPEPDETDDEAGDSKVTAEAAEPKEELPDLTPTHGFEAFHGIDGLAVQEGRLVGETAEIPVLRTRVEATKHKAVLHSIELRMRSSKGSTVQAMLRGAKGFDREEMLEQVRDSAYWPMSAELTPGEEMRTYTLDATRSFGPMSLDQDGHLFIEVADVAGAAFEIESIRFITRQEHLAKIPEGASWQGLSEIYREALVLRAPGRVTVETTLPDKPWLELALGTVQPHPLAFRVELQDEDGQEHELLRRTVTLPDRWEETPLDLQEFAGQTVRLTFGLDSKARGAVGFFGTVIVRNKGGLPRRAADPEALVPQGVIVLLVDTLRRDHLNMYGYERETAPTLAALSREGALFTDNISQGTWTKVSVPSILTSLYPTSHGIRRASDRLPLDVTTLAEVFHEAGFATFATSSVPFSGKMSNLHQGIDVLHERNSIGDLEHSRSKTARTFVDRTLEWLEAHQKSPFYIFLHVFDPHDPFEPYSPYDETWSEPGAKKAHEKDVEIAKEHFEEIDGHETELPDEKYLIAAGLDPAVFVKREKDWYDESIRAMDAEVARLIERLETLGLRDKVVLAFISDHGEEFLEHGRHFHGNATYGEMTNVPLMLWGPAFVPNGKVVDETVQSIDLMPTLLELACLEAPEGMQGQSLLPLVRGIEGWTPRPAFSECRQADFQRERKPEDIDSFSIVVNGYRLVQNIDPPEGLAELELFDHHEDPLNQKDIAAEHPELVEKLTAELELWKKWASAMKVQGTQGIELTPEEIENLKQLGYLK